MTPELETNRFKTLTKLGLACSVLAGAMLAGWGGSVQAQLLAADNLEHHIVGEFPGPGAPIDTASMNGLTGPDSDPITFLPGGNPGWGLTAWITGDTIGVPNAQLVYTPGLTIPTPIEINFTSSSIDGGERAIRFPNGVNSTSLLYRDFPNSLTGTTSDPIRDLWVTMLIRVEQTPDVDDVFMVEIIGQQNAQLNSAPTDVVGLGIREVGGTPRFVAQTNTATGAPAFHPTKTPAGGQNYFVVAWYRASGVSGGLRWDRPRLWVYEEGDPFTLIASAPMGEGTGLTGTYANSLPTGASRIRVRTAGLEIGDIFFMDSLSIARTISEIIDPGDPLRVDLIDFSASAAGAGSPVTVKWETAAEFDNAGFNVYRAATGGPGKKLNAFPIAAQGNETEGAVYSFVDSNPMDRDEVRGYYLEDVEFNGTSTLHGPVRVGPFSAARSSVDSWELYN